MPDRTVRLLPQPVLHGPGPGCCCTRQAVPGSDAGAAAPVPNAGCKGLRMSSTASLSEQPAGRSSVPWRSGGSSSPGCVIRESSCVDSCSTYGLFLQFHAPGKTLEFIQSLCDTWRALSISAPSIRAAVCRQSRPARLALAESISRSRNNTATADSVSGSFLWIARRDFRNNAGSCRIQFRISGDASHQAAYSSPALRLLNLWEAIAADVRWQCSALTRATGTRYFTAA